MSEEKKQLDVFSEEEFETFVENAIDAFEEKVQKNEYIDEIEEFFQLLEKANRWDDLTYYIEEDQLKLPSESSYWMWKIKVAIQNEQFKQVEAWLVHENVIAALGMDKVLECTLLCEKEKNRFTQAEVEKLQQLSERLKKEEPLTEEQNDYMATTLMLMQTPLKWTVIEAFLMRPLTQLFWKGFLIECWLTDGKTSKIRYYDAFSEKVVEVDKSEIVSVYDHPVFVEIERLIDTQNALEEDMRELLLQKAQSDFIRVSPFIDRYFSDGAEWLEMQLQRENLLLSLYENDETFIRTLKA
ncbi:MAG: hypothetical protein HXO97_01695 [Streptococcus sp.]|nr:hypothetical protein [Streptococcus sp.]